MRDGNRANASVPIPGGGRRTTRLGCPGRSQRCAEDGPVLGVGASPRGTRTDTSQRCPLAQSRHRATARFESPMDETLPRIRSSDATHSALIEQVNDLLSTHGACSLQATRATVRAHTRKCFSGQRPQALPRLERRSECDLATSPRPSQPEISFPVRFPVPRGRNCGACASRARPYHSFAFIAAAHAASFSQGARLG